MLLILKAYFLKNTTVHENIGMSAKYGIRASYFGRGGDLLGLAYLK